MPRTRRRTARSQPAFTLVELMVAIIIIALLLGILMPVLSKAYNTALATADSALIHQISMGLETYQQAFHAYPSSTWVDSSVPVPAAPAKRPTGWWPPAPMLTGSTDIEANSVALTGAAKAFASLAGFNTIGDGTNAVGCGDANFHNWRYPCGQLTHRGILVPEAAGSLTEKQPPYGPYYLASDKQHGSVGVTWGSVSNQPQEVFTSRFQLETVPAGGDPGAGSPVLYYLANAAPRDTDGNGVIDSWDIYDYADNYLITDPAQTPPAPIAAVLSPDTVALGDRWRHPLYAPSDGKTATNAIYDSVSSNNFSVLTNQYYGITRPFTKTGTAPIINPTVPYNANTYILISAGPDGRYFTADDITNYR